MYKKSYLGDKYENVRHNIEKMFYIEDNYETTLEKTKDFLELIKKEGASNYNFHFAYMMFSKAYNNLAYEKNDMKLKSEAIKNVELSKEYLYDYNDIDTLTVENMWQLAMCYKDLDNDKALDYFDKCYDFCRLETGLPKKGLELHLSGVLDEIAVLTKDIEAVKMAIEILHRINGLQEQYKQNCLNKMYEHEFDLCIHNNNMVNAMRVIHNITDIKKVKELKMKLTKLA